MGCQKTRRQRLDRILWLAVVLLLAARCHLLWVRIYDPDELEHIHAGYCVARGQVPYRDFFEHHGPLTYWLGSILVWIDDSPPTALHVHRLASLGLTFVCVVGVWRLGRTVYGRRSAVWAVLALLTLPSFVEKHVEWRPDALAAALIPWAAWLVVRQGRASWTSDSLAGLLLGLATLATLKAGPLAVGIALGGILSRLAKGRMPNHPCQSIAAFPAAMLLGVSAPWAVAASVFAWQGALGDAWRCVVVAPITWPVGTFGGDYVWGMTSWAPGHQVLGIVGVALCVLGSHRGLRRGRGEVVLFAAIVFHSAGLLVARAVYFQFYMLALPIAAVLVTGEIGRALRLERRNQRGPITLGIGIFAFGWFCWGAWRRGDGRWLDGNGPNNPYEWLDAVSIGLAPVLLITALVLRSGKWGAFAMAIVLFLPALGRVAIPHVFWPNRDQIAVLEFVQKAVPSDQTILDGFTGFGAFRPHAWYWFWVNEHTLAMIRSAKEADVPSRLARQGKPALIIVDASLAELLSPEDLRVHYVAIRGGQRRPFVLYLRRDLAEEGPPARHAACSG